MNRFFLTSDPKIKFLDDFEIPNEWWSRFYEYQFASKYLNKNDVVLDGGCGIKHPFKWYASKRVKKLYAVDNNKGLNKFEDSSNINYKCISLLDLTEHFEENYFDTIFCISVLEHIPDMVVDVLHQFQRVLKKNGKLIATFDHPFLKPSEFIRCVGKSNFKFIGDVDYSLHTNGVVGLHCYSAVLEREL